MSKPSLPDVIERFRAYYAANPTWGSLHVVLDDGNVRDCDVAWCEAWALESGDPDGAALARILAKMSKTQRRKLSSVLR